LAEQVRDRINPELKFIHQPLPTDDPRQRQPDITLAQKQLEWSPAVSLEIGLDPTIEWFKQLLN
jgi:UDP-glucuronate decarboxylase